MNRVKFSLFIPLIFFGEFDKIIKIIWSDYFNSSYFLFCTRRTKACLQCETRWRQESVPEHTQTRALVSRWERQWHRHAAVTVRVMFIYSRILNGGGEGAEGEGGRGQKETKCFRSSTSGFIFHYTVLNLFYSPFFYTESIQWKYQRTSSVESLCWRGRRGGKSNKKQKKQLKH